MPAIVNPADFIKVGLMSLLFIFGANLVLDKMGLQQFKVQ